MSVRRESVLAMNDDKRRCAFVGEVGRVRRADLRRAILEQVELRVVSTVERRCVLHARHPGDHEVETPTGRPLIMAAHRPGEQC